MEIFIYDDLDPEATAMLQALYSRSAESVERHMEKVRSLGSKDFMSSYYVGYGHASIGDCGNTTLFIEGVSLLACKAMQDNPLYSGQETSTRYIDFSQQPIVDPVGSDASGAILKKWIEFYTQATPALVSHLQAQFPLQADQKEGVWTRAIHARCFDILRGFLPAGVTSQFSWSTNLRQAHDKLSLLRHHPLAEVRDIAGRCLASLKVKYPSSFTHKVYPEREAYLQRVAFRTSYPLYSADEPPCRGFTYRSTVDNKALEAADLESIVSRPPKTELPRHLSQYGAYTCTFPLDYGSFRDLQRHRNGLCPIPLLDGRQGFSRWYLEQLPGPLAAQAKRLVCEQFAAIDRLAGEGADPQTLQYYYPLGAEVKCEILYDLPQMVYVTELRSSATVHPTLRRVAHAMHAALRREHPRLKLYTDLSQDAWSLKRGHQDIIALSA